MIPTVPGASAASRLGAPALALALAAAGCAAQPGDDATTAEPVARQIQALQARAAELPMPAIGDGHAVEYDEIGGGHESARSMDLCELAYLYDGGAGLYRVERIVGAAETEQGPRGSRARAHTYIQLQLEQDWSGFAPERPIVRITGGPLEGDRTQSFALGLRKGERVGVFLFSPLSDQNRGYYRTDAQGVFRELGDGMTNGHLFAHRAVSAQELGQLAGELYASLPRVIHRPPWRPLAIPRDRCSVTAAPDGHRHEFDLDALRANEPEIEQIELDRSPE